MHAAASDDLHSAGARLSPLRPSRHAPTAPLTPTQPPPHRSIYAYTEDRQACASLMAAHGPGATVLERRTVLHGGEWSPVWLQARAGTSADGSQLFVPDAAARRAEDLPVDFRQLHEEAGLRSLAAITIGPPGGEPLGVLLVGKRRANGFDDQWCGRRSAVGGGRRGLPVLWAAAV